MKNVLLSTLCAATALAFSGCGESPFKLNPRADADSVRVEVFEKGDDSAPLVRVNHKRLSNPNELPDALNQIGNRQPKRPVFLVVEKNADPKIERWVQRHVLSANLGKITVMERTEEHGSYHTRPVRGSEPAAPVAPPAPVAETPPPPAAAPAPVAVAPAEPVAPAAPVEPTPAPAPAPAVVVAVSGQPDGSFVVDGKAVSRDALPTVLGEIGAAHPGAPINYTTHSAEPDDSIFFFLKTARNAKLGKVKNVN